MKKYWKSDPMYASLGVDGSVCSIVSYLSEVGQLQETCIRIIDCTMECKNQ